MFYLVYASKHCKENINTLKNDMTLGEFLEYKNFIEIQNSFDQAINKDQEQEMEAQRKRNGR